jgi:hypothetical protein
MKGMEAHACYPRTWVVQGGSGVGDQLGLLSETLFQTKRNKTKQIFFCFESFSNDLF